MAILEVGNLSFTYPLGCKKAIDNISFSVSKGDFITLCGATGSGKSTLLRQLKRELVPPGTREGKVLLNGKDINSLSVRESARSVGYVMQRPEQQLVADRVSGELAFGLENMGVPSDVIRRRVAEISDYFGIESWFYEKVSDLSGGQKQLLNLASVMVMQPEILLLDEPTAQLDPIAASEFIQTVAKLNRELALTVIMVEHRLEEAVPVSDKLMILKDGGLFLYGETREVVGKLSDEPELLLGMPSAVRLYSGSGIDAPCPITVREGRDFVEKHYGNKTKSLPPRVYVPSDKKALQFSDVCFRYSRGSDDVLKDLDLTVYENEIFCILGGNGSGKTTALCAAAGLNRIYSGKIKVFGKDIRDYRNQSLYRNCLSMLPQDVQTVFLKNTVREELEDAGAEISALPYDMSGLLGRHPYDLSGGEQQLAALAKVLASKPRLLLLDEPTKGLDAHAKAGILGVLKDLKTSGMTVVTVTHDVEFAAMCADRCALFFGGNIVSRDTPEAFFAGNSYYTTSANRMTRGYYDGIVTADDLIDICRANGRRGNGD